MLTQFQSFVEQLMHRHVTCDGPRLVAGNRAAGAEIGATCRCPAVKTNRQHRMCNGDSTWCCGTTVFGLNRLSAGAGPKIPRDCRNPLVIGQRLNRDLAADRTAAVDRPVDGYSAQ